MSQQLDSVMLSNKSILGGAGSVSAGGHESATDQNMSGVGDPAQMMAQAQAQSFHQLPNQQ